MPRGRQKRPEPFLKIGKMTITRADSLNWVVSGDERETFHPSLASAMLTLATRVPDSKAKDITGWLKEYGNITAKLIDLWSDMKTAEPK